MVEATFYCLSIAAFPAGAITVGLAAAMSIRRFGSARVALVTSILTAVVVFCAGLAPTAILFTLALFLAGAMDAITDVTQNAHSLRVQRGYGRSILNSFHAIWSIGAVLDGRCRDRAEGAARCAPLRVGADLRCPTLTRLHTIENPQE